MTIDRQIFRQADFIEVAVDNVVKALRDGGILVIVVVAAVPRQPARGRHHADRDAAVARGGHPGRCARSARRINTMTLGGMAIAIGALVDDAIIDVENVVRRLRENAREAAERATAGRRGRPRRDARDPHVDRLRHGHHRAGVPADLRPGRRRRPAADAAGVRLHRVAARVAGRRDRRDAGAVLRVPAERAVRFERGHDGWLARDAEGALRARCCRARSIIRVLVIAASRCCCSSSPRRRMTRMGTAFLPGVPRRQPDGAGEHAAGHVAGQVRRDRPPRRADPAGAAGSRRHGAPHRPRRARRARAGRRSRRDRRRPARDRTGRATSCWRSCGADSRRCPART